MIPYFKNIILLLIISVFSFSFNCYRVSGWLFFFLNFTSLNGNKPWTIFPFEHVLPRWEASAQSTRLFCPSIFHLSFLYVPCFCLLFSSLHYENLNLPLSLPDLNHWTDLRSGTISGWPAKNARRTVSSCGDQQWRQCYYWYNWYFNCVGEQLMVHSYKWSPCHLVLTSSTFL